MESKLPILDFSVLDDLLMAAHDGRIDISEQLGAFTIESIGPAIEYLYHQVSAPNVLPSLEGQINSPLVDEMLRTFRIGGFHANGGYSSLKARALEFGWLPPSSSAVTHPMWTAFRRRVEDAARQAGFGSLIAAGLSASFAEMADNALGHSNLPQSGFCGYRFARGIFEYAVVDAGIGVLESLRQSPDYRDVTDAGTALGTALRDGESRYGRTTGHGFGFRQMFTSLANLNGHLRFRSGDHVLEIREISPALTHAGISQRIVYQGFMVFVCCRLDS